MNFGDYNFKQLPLGITLINHEFLIQMQHLKSVHYPKAGDPYYVARYDCHLINYATLDRKVDIEITDQMDLISEFLEFQKVGFLQAGVNVLSKYWWNEYSNCWSVELRYPRDNVVSMDALKRL